MTLWSLSVGSFLGTTILRELDLMPRTHVPDVTTRRCCGGYCWPRSPF
jgi:hypothetical protein